MYRVYQLLVILIITIGKASFSQDITIQIKNTSGKVYFFEIEGEKISNIDSVVPQNGSYRLSLKDNHHGFYRLQLDSKHFLGFINDGKEIVLKTDYENILDSLKIVKSESNKIYYEFLKLNEVYKTKIELLQLILAHYPKDDKYYKVTQNKLLEIQNEYQEFVQVASQKNPKLFIARYIKSAQLPIMDISIPIEEQLTYLKSHSLDNVNFDDAELISSDMFTNKSIEYLTYFRNQQLSKEILEKEFMKATDTLLNKAKVNQLVYQHITEYLIDGFKKFGFDKIIDYIVENYVIEDDLCLDEGTENSIQRRIDQSKYLSVGTKAPNLKMPDKDGKVIDLSTIDSVQTLLIFYASWCPHCKTLLSQLNEFSTTQTNIEILAISLDSNREDWIKFIGKHSLEFTNLNDPNGWDGTVASDYYIYATPTMFLLDEEKKIVGKPTTFTELEKSLQRP